MNAALEDEILSINAIYSPDTLISKHQNSDIHFLKVPSTYTTLRLSFPATYPDDPPTVLGPESSGSESKKGDAHMIASLAHGALSGSFMPGVPCVFDLIEQITSSLPHESREVARCIVASDQLEEEPRETVPELRAIQQHEEPRWTLSEVITEKKSIFVARAARVSNPDQARSFIQHLLDTDKTVAKATHPRISAYRIKEPSGIIKQDCNDDGETAAGGRLLHLLQIMNAWNVLVVVSRWYGGIKLGPGRFRLINSVAKDALVRGGFDKETNR